jgi:hypothetical protein
MIFSALENHEFNEIFFERYSNAFFTELREYFAQRMDDGAFRRMDPMLAALTFVGMVAHYGQGLALFHKCIVDVPQGTVIQHFIDIFLEGMNNHANS